LLTDKVQTFVVEGGFQILCCVPQGSGLFLICLTDDNIPSKILKYADNTTRDVDK